MLHFVAEEFGWCMCQSVRAVSEMTQGRDKCIVDGRSCVRRGDRALDWSDTRLEFLQHGRGYALGGKVAWCFMVLGRQRLKIASS